MNNIDPYLYIYINREEKKKTTFVNSISLQLVIFLDPEFIAYKKFTLLNFKN
jgi:hypothetical protein